MTRFLAPYIWPLIGALVAALIAAIGWIMLQSAWLDQAEAERDALERRLLTLQAVKGLQNEAENDSDDGLAGSISDVQPGGR